MINPRRFHRFRRWLRNRLADNISTGSRGHVWIDKALGRLAVVNIWIWKKMVVRLVDWYARLSRNGDDHE
jgi:hypothetical protein